MLYLSRALKIVEDNIEGIKEKLRQSVYNFDADYAAQVADFKDGSHELSKYNDNLAEHAETMAIIQYYDDDVREILLDNFDVVEEISELLLEHETLNRSELFALLGWYEPLDGDLGHSLSHFYDCLHNPDKFDNNEDLSVS